MATDYLNAPPLTSASSASTSPAASTPTALNGVNGHTGLQHSSSIDDVRTDTASTRPQVGTPLDPDSIPIHPPHGTPPPPTGHLLKDVEMAEQRVESFKRDTSTPTSLPPVEEPEAADEGDAPNGMDVDVIPPSPALNQPMSELDINQPSSPSQMSPPAPPTFDPSSSTSSVPRERPTDETAETQRPAKRARNGTYDGAAPLSLPLSTINPAQHKFATSTIRTLKKQKDAIPFSKPVDYLALNIPHYPNVIKTPMDLSTVERKLASSNPTKPDLDPTHPRYTSVEEFTADVKLIFQNCYTFNGVDHVVSQMGKRLEEMFDKQIKHIPIIEEKKVIPKRPSPVALPPPPPPVIDKKPVGPSARRASQSVLPTIRRSDSGENGVVGGRPKREIHPPPSKDLPYEALPIKTKSKKGKGRKREKDDGTLEQLRYCVKIITDMYKRSYADYAYHFYDPVDRNLVPNYYSTIKKPMDLSTMKRKLDRKEYANANQFHSDFKLMIRNCFTFNQPGSVVHTAGAEVQRVFDDKWRHLPPLHEIPPDSEEDEDESEDEKAGMISLIESQMETMKEALNSLRQPKKDKSLKHAAKKLAKKSGTGGAGPSKAKPSSPKKTSKKRKAEDDIDGNMFTFEQKKELSETIQTLEGEKLERVIQIIHEGVPSIGENSEEIEVEIDTLPPHVLKQLWNFAVRPKYSPPKPIKGNRNVAATGGVKKKTMDESAEAAKIKALQEKLNQFNPGAGAAVATVAPSTAHVGADDDSVESSDSDSGSGSDSGSESD